MYQDVEMSFVNHRIAMENVYTDTVRVFFQKGKSLLNVAVFWITHRRPKWAHYTGLTVDGTTPAI